MDQDLLERSEERIAAVNASIDFFSGRNKWIREGWVVQRLLSMLEIQYDEAELTQWEEPVDVAFRGARFQIKELMQFPDSRPRRRHDEYRSELKRVEKAETTNELTSLTRYRVVKWDKIVTESLKATQAKIQKYPSDERRKLEFVCYYNRHDCFEASAPAPCFDPIDCRSFSIVSDSHVMVLFATESAPAFLKDTVGDLRSGHSG